MSYISRQALGEVACSPDKVWNNKAAGGAGACVTLDENLRLIDLEFPQAKSTPTPPWVLPVVIGGIALFAMFRSRR